MKEIGPDSVIVYSTEEAVSALFKYKTIQAIKGGFSKQITTLAEAESFFGKKAEIPLKLPDPVLSPLEKLPIQTPDYAPRISTKPFVKPLNTVEKCKRCDGDGIIFDIETRKIWEAELAQFGKKVTAPKKCVDCEGTGTRRRIVSSNPESFR